MRRRRDETGGRVETAAVARRRQTRRHEVIGHARRVLRFVVVKTVLRHDLDHRQRLVVEDADREFRPVNSVIMANVLEAICDIWALRQFAVRDIGLPAFKDEIMRLIDASLCVETNAPAEG